MSESDRKAQIKKVRVYSPTIPQMMVTLRLMYTYQTNGIFQLNVKNTSGKEATWV